jgi:hypothetical protein
MPALRDDVQRVGGSPRSRAGRGKVHFRAGTLILTARIDEVVPSSNDHAVERTPATWGGKTELS